MRLRSPKEMGGEGGGTNPEQLFAVGYAACFESALGVAGRRERAEVGDVSIDSRVSLLPTAPPATSGRSSPAGQAAREPHALTPEPVERLGQLRVQRRPPPITIR